MAFPAKIERNKQIVALRNKKKNGRHLYSFSALGEMFKLEKPTVHEIYWREMAKLSQEGE